ncbi:MAG: hypothetical protein WB780_02165 [Candidatus Acidiferrales bacterium]
MFRNKWIFAMAAALLIPVRAVAAGQDDPQAYCTYVLEQAEAQRDLLRTPAATAGFTQPETGLPVQLLGGAQLGLSDFRKAGLTMEAARKNCEVYKSTTEVQQVIQYAVPSLEKAALLNRLTLIDQGMKSLLALMDQTTAMLEAQNATRLMLFNLQTTRIRLEADRADTQSKANALYFPPLNDQPLKDLVAQKQSSEQGEQKAIDKLTRQNNWDVVLSIGAHQQVNPVAQGVQPYGTVSINYNLASHAINKHLDRAAEAHDEWKKAQESDVVRQAEVLRQQLQDSAAAQDARLKSLQEENKQLKKNLDFVSTPDTSAAFDFRNQLSAAQILLQIETADATFRLTQLRDYVEKNF